jgi:hypothetical protein
LAAIFTAIRSPCSADDDDITGRVHAGVHAEYPAVSVIAKLSPDLW